MTKTQAFRLILFTALLGLLPVLRVFAQGYDLSDPGEPWRNAKAGISSEVPPPFEPLVVNGARVRLWGRSYTLGGAFPTQIDNQGKPTFVASPRLVLVANGERHEFKGGTPELTLKRADRVEWRGAETAGGVRVESSSWLEYDGVARIDLTLSADAPTAVKSFVIEFPLHTDVARFCHYNTVWGGHGNPEVPQESGETLDFPWQAMWWLGDHDRGLSLFTENNFEWSSGESAVRIERGAEATVFRFNIWGESSAERTLDKPVTFSIGLHATPSKPLPKDWHARYVSFGGCSEQLPGVYATIWHHAEKYYSYPQPADDGEFRERIRAAHERGERVCPYFTSAGTSPDAPTVKRHYKAWIRSKKDGEPLWLAGSVDSGRSRNVSLCSASAFTDFMAWGMTKFLAEYDVDGLYFDNAGPYPCASEQHGCRRGDKASTPIFANREFYKRMYSIVKQLPRVGGIQRPRIVWQHTSRYMISTALSFVDIYSDGEQFRFDRHSQPLSDISSSFRAMTFTGSQWGAQPCFLPAMSSAKPWLTQWGMAVTLPYGNLLIPSPGWTDFTAQARLLQVRRDFVRSGEVRFYRPHELPAWLQVRLEIEREGKRTTGEVAAGAYVRARDRSVLLVVSNLSDRAGAVRFNTAALRQNLGGDIEVIDALTDAPSKRANADPYMHLSIAAGTCRMWRVERLAE
ncbi:MAG: DUF6067 family protein [Planctomycetes bacterium]|nr:DUF6067 family protein [Planctomycetota bacterium]